MNFKVDIAVCRVCMKSENGFSLLKDRNLLEKFVYTTKIKVKEEDSMPVILCAKCIARLKIAYEFCRLANSSERHLRKFINKISTDFQEVTKAIPDDDEDPACLDEEEDDIHALVDESGNFEQISEHAFHLKEESIVMTEELEVVEVPEAVATKQEVFENEIYMEEFHEIIQEDNCDTNLYLDENSAEELHLYEDNLFEDEERELEEGEREVEETNVDQPEVVSSIECAEEKEPSKAEKKPSRRMNLRSRKRAGPSASSKLEGKSNICIKCNKDFSTKTNLMRHMSTHDGVRPYQCNICGKGFTQNGSLKQHMFIHTGERPHVCHVCQRGFTQSKSLIFHMRRHTGEKPFTCDECGISFRQKDGLKHHVIKYHSGTPATPERHICCVCDRILASKYSLGVHMRKHTRKVDDKNPEADFDSENTVATNKDQPNSETPPPQPETPAPAAVTSTVIEAETSNESSAPRVTGNAGAGVRMKQFQCGKCFKSFHIKRNLLRHLRNHDVSSLELHECADCKIGFDTKRSLKLHRQRDHKDLIPDLNNCEYCDAPYVTVADLSVHIANVHDAIDQDCPHCNAHFKSQKIYYDHLLEHEHMLED